MINEENIWKLGLHENGDFKGGIENMSDQELINKLSESSNMPHDNKGNKIIHHNEHFHCSDKGCDIEMKLIRTDFYGDYAIHKYCHTHNKECSRTGWEMGWYLGRQRDWNKNNNGLTKHIRNTSPIITLKDGVITKLK